MANKLTRLLASDEQSRQFIARVLRENGRKYLSRYVLAFILMGVVAVLTGASAWILKSIVNDVFVERNETMLWIVASGVFLIFAGRGFADYAQAVVMGGIERDIIREHQNKVYDHLLAQDMKFFNNASIGDVMMYFNHGTHAVSGLMNLLLTSLGKDLFSLLSLGFVMVTMDPVLAMIALVITPGALFGIRKLKAKIRALGKQEMQGMAQVITRLKDSMIGVRVVKSFSMEDRMRGDMSDMVHAVTRRAFKIRTLGARSGPIMESLVGLAIAAIIIYAANGFGSGSRDPGALLAFLAALLMTYTPAKNLARLTLNLETTLIGVGAMYSFLDKAPAFSDKPNARDLVIQGGEVELRDVSFAYGKHNALNDVSVLFPAGKVSALVGASGAGKSTVFALVERFYDTTSGSILIDGQNIRDVTMRSLRQNIAYVTQDSFLFEGSIRQNIMAGRASATEEEMIAAAKAAHAHDFIMDAQGGYDRQVGEGGGNLSGGQKQRIAIARAMLRNAPILLLDEATSALDTESEVKVREALDVLMKGRTTIVIAHRLSTVRMADVIHVMDKGKVVESGTHDELVALGGTYARLSALQFVSDPRDVANLGVMSAAS